MIARYRAWRRRRLVARLEAWVGMTGLSTNELVRVGLIRKNGRTPAFAADRVEATRARRRLSATPGGFANDAVHGHFGGRR